MKETLKNVFHHHKKTETATPIAETTVTTVTAPTLVTPVPAPAVLNVTGEKIEHAPIIHERVRPEEVHEVQPVIHRDIEKTEIHQVKQSAATKEVLPVQVEQRTLPAEFRAPVTLPAPVVAAPPMELNTVEQLQSRSYVVEKPAIIEETVHKRVIEEVQPGMNALLGSKLQVIYKETIQPHLVRETLPIYEKIVEPPTVIYETRQAAPLQEPLPPKKL